MSRLSRHLVGEKRLATAIDGEYLPDTIGLTDFTVRALPAPGVDAHSPWGGTATASEKP